jgi:hypothetical protein
MLSVEMPGFKMLGVIMPNVDMLSVAFLVVILVECRYAECPISIAMLGVVYADCHMFYC